MVTGWPNSGSDDMIEIQMSICSAVQPYPSVNDSASWWLHIRVSVGERIVVEENLYVCDYKYSLECYHIWYMEAEKCEGPWNC
ncbi:hypothetical protein NC651_010169 [Populus alba x Populus x berolinensis]|uniref:Uncharacterized protein n=1 Tax=Populus alba x Populus x berolinensis TaxID=444605 RepID=A0AAD6R018_9ROSI|nr:hypothetical protein NC651_010169 [Populus alba x Populus x berolinensis]KAJ6999643.1 hypothetical protein NC653_010395 [Populus alba x Populus x berolinensis]